MDDSSIKSIPKSPVVPNALKKKEQEGNQAQKQKAGKKQEQSKDPKRIIDTYV